MPSAQTPSPRTRVRREPERGRYDRATIDAILDEGLVCHLGFVHGGGPVVIPTLYARADDTIYAHGSAASRMLRALASGCEACLTVTLLDGLVLARSAFHHSVNYRSVVVFGQARLVDDPDERMDALRLIVERVMPGRWDDTRWPNDRELRQTSVLAIPVGEASAKLRTGGPKDEPEDYGLPHWAGVVPLRLVADAPEPDAGIDADVPDYLGREVAALRP